MAKRKGKTKNLDVSIHLGRPTGGLTEEDGFRLRIEDKASGVIVMEIELDVSAFADLMSIRQAKGQAVLSTSDVIGKRMENQTVYFELAKYGDMKRLLRLAKSWDAENAPWKVDEYDLKQWNSHRFADGRYSVTARRYVED